MINFLEQFFVLFLCLVVAGGCSENRSSEPSNHELAQIWTEDFTQLQVELTQKYANLSDIERLRNLNFYALSKQTEKNFANAKNDKDAQEIIKNFIESFHDGHLRIKKSKNIQSLSAPPELTLNLQPQAACEVLGRIRKTSWTKLFDQSKFSNVQTRSFPNGILFENGKRIAVIRIGSFTPFSYQETCRKLWKPFAKGRDGKCGRKCEEIFYDQVEKHLTEDLSSLLEYYEKKKVDALLVDLTGNGGGSNFAVLAARLFVPSLKWCQPLELVRNPRHAAWPETLASNVTKEVEKKNLSSREAEAIEKLKSIARNEAKAHREGCSNVGIWQGKPFSCDIRTKSGRTACGLLPSVPTSLLSKSKSLRMAMSTQPSWLRPNRYSGKLFLLMDSKSASATELFAVLIRGNRNVTVIGKHSAGSGCGYYSGGNSIRLKHSGLVVEVPNCTRRNHLGQNEISGVSPDLKLNLDLTQALARPKLLDAITNKLKP